MLAAKKKQNYTPHEKELVDLYLAICNGETIVLNKMPKEMAIYLMFVKFRRKKRQKTND